MCLKLHEIHEAKTELKERVEKSIIIIGDFNIPFSVIDRNIMQKIIQDIEPNNTINLIHIYINSTTTEYNIIHIIFQNPWKILCDKPYFE